MLTPVSFSDLKDRFAKTKTMPVVFLGHGSPMNAITDNPFQRTWAKLGEDLPRPSAILVVSAHWMTRGTTLVHVGQRPRTIHDFYGFPDELFAQRYAAPGAPDVARHVKELLSSHHAEEDETWGLDHGAWSVLKFLFPKADVPVFQVSIDMKASLDHHIQIGRELAQLREHGVLILGSGNVVHNLRALDMSGRAQDFALEFDEVFAKKVEDRNFDYLADARSWGSLLPQAHPTVDHYVPALTVLGASSNKDELHFFNEDIDLGSVSMRSFVMSR